MPDERIEKEMLIATDFDGVIRDAQGYPRSEEFWADPPVKDAIKAINQIIAHGHKVYILTARTKKWHAQIASYCERHGMMPVEVTNVKKDKTQLIIDDRAIRFTNWMDTVKYIL